MTIRIEIKTAELQPRHITIGKGPKAGQTSTIYEQEAWVTLLGNDGKPRPFPQRIVLNIDVDRKQAAFPVGVYSLGDTSFFINRFAQLEIGRIGLVPVAAQQPQASRAA